MESVLITRLSNVQSREHHQFPCSNNAVHSTKNSLVERERESERRKKDTRFIKKPVKNL